MSSLPPRRSCHHFSLDEIKDATNHFDKSNVLGQGGEGMVYIANLYIGSKKARVAVKRLKPNSDEFENEIQLMTNIQHPHPVSLLGYCKESDEKIFVYKYMEKGSLSIHVNKQSNISLSWQERLSICLGAARGLQYLHNETEEFPKGIIHRDVKPENILLDEEWVAKVSDFGMFKVSLAGQRNSTMCTNLKGTSGYYAPEYLSHRQITRKIDVYAFGVVLFEVLCRKMPWDRGTMSYYRRDDEDLGLWAKENVDTRIKGEISEESLLPFTDIIGRSLQADPRKRPTMNSVVLNLEMALERHVDEDEARKLRPATVLSTGKSESDEERNFVKKDDLEHLRKLIAEKDGGPAKTWIQITDRSWSNKRYQVWSRNPEARTSGPTEYRWRMEFQDITPEIIRDFFWEEEFQLKWDANSFRSKILDKCPITGTMVVKRVGKSSFDMYKSSSYREYIIGCRIWESGRSYYCVTKSVPYPNLSRRNKPIQTVLPRDAPKLVDFYYSSWRIRPFKSRSRNGELINSCEVLLFHHVNRGNDWNSSRLYTHHLSTYDGLLKYKSYRAKGEPLSQCALMAQITTKVSSESDQLRYLESSTSEKVPVETRPDSADDKP